MYYDEFFPFYEVYADSGLCREEERQERERNLLKSWYPETIRRLQEIAEEEGQRLDYEGSRIYDEYPDRTLFWRLCSGRRFQEDDAGDCAFEDGKRQALIVKIQKAASDRDNCY